MAKLAYLILAHESPQHLRRLVASLASDTAECFIHLDAKSRAPDFAEIRSPRVRFTRERIRVHWGDFSIVEATLVLLRAALAHPARCERFVLLSGADFPLRPASEIERFFERRRDAEFMQLLEMPCGAQGKPLARLSVYQSRPGTSRFARQLRRSLVQFGALPRRRNPAQALRGLRPYAGSQWWALTREACEYLLAFSARERWLARFYAHTHCPDESYFHSVLGNSPFAVRVRPALTWADWSGGGRNPALISEAQLARLEAEQARCGQSGAPDAGPWLFARKFNDESEAIVARLARYFTASRNAGLSPPPCTKRLAPET